MLCQRCGEREAEIFLSQAVRRALDRVVETPTEPGH